ncbi:OLC1v1022328C1 [Oldenlandia corymbosa var. corymbosa]|uniref:OLC1v1022328C1 n=1 Tax=Oldenlandia corymbosa var. corymbosa TaxID=529605 RepID=A0AAV1BXM1_OLDCO|nr:OLC1v1022328C1 [Oldenlandia corymbosa var. corymbosa]
MVNGLLCLYRDNKSWLYNIDTREALKLPDSPPSNYEDGIVYHLGFVPVNKWYKLLKTCCCQDDDVAILTVGVDSCWRMLLGVQSEQNIDSQSKCLGGILCWAQSNNRIIAFDLTRERFIHIDPIPQGVFPFDSYELHLHLANFRPNLVVTGESWYFNSKILRYDLNTSNGCGTWVDELPELPRIIQVPQYGASIYHPVYLTVLGIVPEGKMMIVYDHSINCKSPTLYLYPDLSGTGRPNNTLESDQRRLIEWVRRVAINTTLRTFEAGPILRRISSH